MPRPRLTVCFGSLLAAGFAITLAGCGVGAYEERLQRTNTRNQHFAKLDEALLPYWNHAGYGLWLRPPKGFTAVPPPARPKDEETEPPPDKRQEFEGVALDLPGVIQAWDGLLPQAGGGTALYRLYILGNHERFTAPDRFGKPVDFLHDLETSLQELYGVELPPGDAGRGEENNVKYRISIPLAEQFSPQQSFHAVNFVPPMTGRPPFHAWLFEHTKGDIQTAVLMLTPAAASPLARQSLLTSLETLRVSSQRPQGAPAGASSTSSAPARADF